MTRRRQIVGWIAVGVSTAIASLWAFWGTVEGFHEGWYYRSFPMNLGLMLAQYLLPMLLFQGVSLVSLRWPGPGSGLHFAAAVAAAWFLRRASLTVVVPLVVVPLLMLSAAYWWGRPRPRQWAAVLLIAVPFAAVLASGVEPALRVAGRRNDEDRGPRRLTVNGVDLVWAPHGPGWPSDGVSWEEAMRRCRYLKADGTALADTPQNTWRLPTVGEAVASQFRGGRSSEGSWDPVQQKASYRRMPDKESPLWDVHSKVIYWWTATEAPAGKALTIAYDGRVWARPKSAQRGYLAFRSVRTPRP